MKTVAVFSEATLPGRFAADLEALLFNLIRVEIAPVDLTEAKALAYDARRGQIDAEALLDILKSASGFDKTAYIIEGDAYVHGLNYVFGAAYGDKALVFTARLRAEDEGLYRRRTRAYTALGFSGSSRTSSGTPSASGIAQIGGALCGSAIRCRTRTPKAPASAATAQRN